MTPAEKKKAVVDSLTGSDPVMCYPAGRYMCGACSADLEGWLGTVPLLTVPRPRGGPPPREYHENLGVDTSRPIYQCTNHKCQNYGIFLIVPEVYLERVHVPT